MGGRRAGAEERIGTMSKSYLLLRVKGAACADEFETIKALLKNFGTTFMERDWISYEEFIVTYDYSQKFDAIYLGAHADGEGFGVNDGSELCKWSDLAGALCATDAMVPGGLLFLGCCRGGMKVVALEIMRSCPKIDYVAGPNWKANAGDLVLGFNVFINTLIRYKEEPTVAAERASAATGQKFCCYDRQELAGDVALMHQLDRIESDQKKAIERLECLEAVVHATFDDVKKLLPKEPQADSEKSKHQQL